MCKCPGEEHPTYGACLRAKGIRVAYCNSADGQDATSQKRWDSRLDEMAECSKLGVVPKSTALTDIRAAMDHSAKIGRAFDAGAR